MEYPPAKKLVDTLCIHSEEAPVILAKSKSALIPGLTIRPRVVIIAIVCLFLLFSGIYVYTRIHSPQHCVMEVQPEGSSVPSSNETHCFATQAEAINYGSGGRIDLPPDASQSDIDKALNNQSP